jgi:hypothetical protein
MKDEDLAKLLLDKIPGKRISCAEARKLAEDLQIELFRFRTLCDLVGIRIFNCQLGCF